MKFSRRPDGLWCGYSTIANSFYELKLDKHQLMAEVMRDMAYQVARRYKELVEYNGGYSFDDVIDEFRYCDDKKRTRAFWINYFTRAGCSEEQMRRVNERLDRLEHDGDIITKD